MKVQRLVVALAVMLLASACSQITIRSPYETSPSASAPAQQTASSSLPPDEGPLEAGDVAMSAAASDAPAPEGSFAMQERVTAEGALELGGVTAPLLTVFTNHACAYCAEFARDYLPRLEEDFLKKGLLRINIVFVPFAKYPNSTAEADAVYCAARQEKGLGMHKALFALRARTRQGVLTTANELELDAKAFTECIDSQATKEAGESRERWAIVVKNVTLVPSFDHEGVMKTGLPSYPDLRGWLENTVN